MQRLASALMLAFLTAICGCQNAKPAPHVQSAPPVSTLQHDPAQLGDNAEAQATALDLLGRPVPDMRFRDVSLDNVAKRLGEFAGAIISVDWQAIHSAGAANQILINTQWPATTLDDALAKVLSAA